MMICEQFLKADFGIEFNFDFSEISIISNSEQQSNVPKHICVTFSGIKMDWIAECENA